MGVGFVDSAMGNYISKGCPSCGEACYLVQVSPSEYMITCYVGTLDSCPAYDHISALEAEIIVLSSEERNKEIENG